MFRGAPTDADVITMVVNLVQEKSAVGKCCAVVTINIRNALIRLCEDGNDLVKLGGSLLFDSVDPELLRGESSLVRDRRRCSSRFRFGVPALERHVRSNAWASNAREAIIN